MSVRLVVVDDHRLFREGLKALLTTQPDLVLVGEAAEAQGAYAVVDSMRPDVVILDVSLPLANGVSVAREVLRRQPQQRILALSMFADEEHVAQAFEVGVTGYASKDLSAPELFGAIRSVAQGQAYLAPGISRIVLDECMRMRRNGRGDSPLQALTHREHEIFDLAVRGLSNHDIASQLCISKRTVETHRGRIMRKLHVHSATDLVRLAARHGLLDA
ncbi:MAG TPA: response regulator transcription factor [Myxococcales bacterium]|nr:response regulator transcription factor [Myxococcales bacterium]